MPKVATFPWKTLQKYVATSKVISLLARNNENHSYNKLYQTDPKFIFNGYILIFDIQSVNISKDTYNIFFFQKVFLSSVNTHAVIKQFF